VTKVRAAIVGLGAISFEHLAKLRRLPIAEVVGICDLSETLARAVSERFGVRSVFTQFDEMLTETGPDVVHVLTPPQSHRELALQALERGMHVVVEKPIAPTWEDYVEMRDAARDRGLLLIENYNWRFVNVVRRALELKRTGRVGEVVNVEVSFGGVMQDPSDPLGDRDVAHFAHALPGGALQNFATHPISLALAFMDGFTGVAAWQRKLDPAWPSNDELKALLAAERSCGVIAVTRHAQPAHFTLAVRGTAGTIEVDLYNARLHMDAAGSGMVKVTNGLRHGMNYLGSTAALVAKTATARHDHFEGLQTLLAEFYDAVATSGPSPIPISEMDRVNEVVRELFAAENQL
jgi:predicted dehydrogenase